MNVRFPLSALAILKAAVLVATRASSAQPPEAFEHARQYVVHSPYPQYPYAARAEMEQGKGLFRVDIDQQTGAVTGVQVLQTTGHKRLDEAAIKALQKWRFRAPFPFRAVRIPVSFTLTRDNFRSLEKFRANAIYSPIPPYPIQAPMGVGRFEVIVDFETGLVRDVRVLKTTGDRRLDRSVTGSFRKWRFRPRTTHSFTTPFNFL